MSVVDKETNAPLSGVCIRVIDMTDAEADGVLLEACDNDGVGDPNPDDGVFEIDNVKPGVLYEIDITSPPEYACRLCSTTVKIDPGETRQKSIKVPTGALATPSEAATRAATAAATAEVTSAETTPTQTSIPGDTPVPTEVAPTAIPTATPRTSIVTITLDAGGAGVPDGCVLLQGDALFEACDNDAANPNPNPAATQVSDTDPAPGVVKLEKIPYGDYAVVVTAPNFALPGQPPVLKVNRRRVALAVPLEASGEQPTATVEAPTPIGETPTATQEVSPPTEVIATATEALPTATEVPPTPTEPPPTATVIVSGPPPIALPWAVVSEPDEVYLIGDFQQQLNCPDNWSVECDAAKLERNENDDGTWTHAFLAAVAPALQPGTYKFDVVVRTKQGQTIVLGRDGQQLPEGTPPADVATDAVVLDGAPGTFFSYNRLTSTIYAVPMLFGEVAIQIDGDRLFRLAPTRDSHFVGDLQVGPGVHDVKVLVDQVETDMRAPAQIDAGASGRIHVDLFYDQAQQGWGAAPDFGKSIEPKQLTVNAIGGDGAPVAGACFVLVNGQGAPVSQACDDADGANDGATTIPLPNGVDPGGYTLAELRTPDGTTRGPDVALTLPTDQAVIPFAAGPPA